MTKFAVRKTDGCRTAFNSHPEHLFGLLGQAVRVRDFRTLPLFSDNAWIERDVRYAEPETMREYLETLARMLRQSGDDARAILVEDAISGARPVKE